MLQHITARTCSARRFADEQGRDHRSSRLLISCRRLATCCTDEDGGNAFSEAGSSQVDCWLQLRDKHHPLLTAGNRRRRKKGESFKDIHDRLFPVTKIMLSISSFSVERIRRAAWLSSKTRKADGAGKPGRGDRTTPGYAQGNQYPHTCKTKASEQKSSARISSNMR